jgi:hypothetical protein
MFVETITLPRPEWETWTDSLNLSADPQSALVASVTWDSGDRNVTALNVWDSAEAIGDFYMARVKEIVQQEGVPSNRPKRHGEPIVFYVRR